VVALGSTAAQSLLGASFRVTQHRGEVVTSEWAGPVIATVHPSSVLRAPDEARAEARRDFFRDIAKVAKFLKKSP
jgi:uracil-DNA glycosylase family 4